ncbi:MAG TPA: NAD(P)-dependent oxidoreductase [Candidatus Binatia bacterium]|jgi:dihydropyrimidine dehydrogenase (NAD+) subunit PreT|nr:NAD(P)-dependent oxidoreductase [Candidatus Binatia bacterium]
MPISPKLTLEAASANLAEIAPPYTPQEAAIEASRCLFCFDAPCIQACPTGIDVPSFIKKITTGNLTGSARAILSANILGASCARVCPTEVLCEGACVMLDREGDPVKIGRLQRYATDQVLEKKQSILRVPAKKSGKRVAVIGGGPAGLGCAAELAQLGHQVIVFEKKPNAGGLNTYGIAYYKMKPEVSLQEVEMIRGLGVEFRCGIEVGKDISHETIQKEFDAVFLGLGLGKGARLNVPGEDLPEVIEALDFIEQVHTLPLHEVPVGERVAVIGGGNTAIDAVTQAKRLGARDAVIVYRRSQEEMPAYDFEQELAKRDGARFLFNVAPLEILSNGTGHVTGLKLARVASANGKLQILAGTEFVEPFDMVIKAIGEEKQAALFKKLLPALELDRRGVVVSNPDTGQTNIPRVFTGGDCANGGREVVNAVAEGKKAARGIHALFAGGVVIGPVQPSRYGVKGEPLGAGFEKPIRVRELEAEYAKQTRT